MNDSPPRVLTVGPDESVADVLLRLRTESFDAVVAEHRIGFDALVLARALRGAGDQTPLALRGVSDRDARAAGADFGCPDARRGDLAIRLAAAIADRNEQRAARLALVADQQRLSAAHTRVDRLATTLGRQLAELREVAGPDVRRYPAAEPAPQEPPARAA